VFQLTGIRCAPPRGALSFGRAAESAAEPGSLYRVKIPPLSAGSASGLGVIWVGFDPGGLFDLHTHFPAPGGGNLVSPSQGHSSRGVAMFPW